MINDSELQQITTWCNSNLIQINDKQIGQMVRYLDLIREASKKMNLVSPKDLNSLIERHLLDSLHALVGIDIKPNSHCADLGSGAGFPGIPIAIVRPDIMIDLIESRRLKSLFLGKAANELHLENVKVVHGRWEEQTASYDFIFARAVYNESDLRKLALPRLKPEGRLVYFEKFMKLKVINN
jgi:16S rRNA (guanine527-N7)-methyltransferase